MKPKADSTDETLPAGREVSLIVKDGVRGIRFAAKQSAKRLVSQMVKSSEKGPSWVPPLGPVAQLVSEVADKLDSMAVQLVSSANDYRHMKFRLLTVTGDSERSLFQASAQVFQHNFYWVFKHLLKHTKHDNVTVKEEALHRVWLSLQSEPDRMRGEEFQARQLAELALAICKCAPLQVHPHLGVSAEIDAQSSPDLELRLVIAAVLAGEIAARYPGADLQEEVRYALHTADSVAASLLADFQRAFASKQALLSLTNEMAFALRHI